MHPATLPLIVVAGPTAVGKSALVYRLIDDIGRECFEVINGDAIQHYRGVDIGSAKPSRMVQRRYRHHLIDVLEPEQRYSVVEFVRRVWAAAAAIVARGRIPILCGGSMYFIFHVCHGLPQTPPSNALVREQLGERLRVEGKAALHRELERVDPVRARAVSPNDTFRVIRNLEIFYVSGMPPSHFLRAVQERCYFHCAYVLLDMDRVSLRERVTARVQEMWGRGLASEVAALVRRGYGADAPALRAIGYRQFFDAHGGLRMAEMREGRGDGCADGADGCTGGADGCAGGADRCTGGADGCTDVVGARTDGADGAACAHTVGARTDAVGTRTTDTATHTLGSSVRPSDSSVRSSTNIAARTHTVGTTYVHSRASNNACNNNTKCHTHACICASNNALSGNDSYMHTCGDTKECAVCIEIKQDIVRATMRYIKHQRTFMRQLPAARHYAPDEYVAIMRYVRMYMSSRLTRQALG